MNNTQATLLNRALELASYSSCSKQHAAIVAVGPRILSVGVNTWRNDPEICSNPKIEASFHAERNALKQLEGRDLSRAVLYSARRFKNGRPAPAKPCSFCAKLIREYGIRQVFYTDYRFYSNS